MSTPDFHLPVSTLSDYAARRLPPSGVLAVSDHLAGCAVCREKLAWLRPADDVRAAGFLPDPDADAAPTYEEMAAQLDGALSPGQTADLQARLSAAPGAAAEFADLRAFRDRTRARPAAVHGPAAPGRIVAFPLWAKVALAAAAVVLLNVGWWHFAVKGNHTGSSLLAGADLASLPADLRRRVETAVRTGRLEWPAASPGLRPPAGTLAGAPDASGGGLKLVSPVGEVVRGDRPRLRWQGRPDATGYVVYLAEVDGGAAPVSQGLPAGRTDWPPPAPLRRGVMYEWQIEARRGEEVVDRAPRPPAPEGRFQVLDAARADELDRIERLAHGNALILGAAYAQDGLREAAAAQFRALARAHPESAEARRLAADPGS